MLDADFCAGRSGLSLRLVERAAPTTRLHSVSNQVGRATCVLHSPVGGLLRSPGGTFTTRVGQWPRANRRTPRSDLFGDDRRYYVGCLASSAAGWTMGHDLAQRADPRGVSGPGLVSVPGSVPSQGPAKPHIGGYLPAGVNRVRWIDSHATAESGGRTLSLRTRPGQTRPPAGSGRVASHDFARRRGPTPSICVNERI